MFVGGIAGGMMMLLVLAVFGLASMGAMALSVVLRVFGVPFGRGIWISLGIASALTAVFVGVLWFGISADSQRKPAAIDLPPTLPTSK